MSQTVKAPPIVVVSGLPRSGTTMTMAMLDAGGIPVVADNRASYEASAVRLLRIGQGGPFLEKCRGKAVKILRPVVYVPPYGYRYVVIWLDRDFEQQARSWNKFQSAMGVPTFDARRLAESFPRERKRSLEIWHQRQTARLIVRFEQVLEMPGTVARSMATYLSAYTDHEPDVEAMAAVVKPRGPECLDGFLELDLAAEERKRGAGGQG